MTVCMMKDCFRPRARGLPWCRECRARLTAYLRESSRTGLIEDHGLTPEQADHILAEMDKFVAEVQWQRKNLCPSCSNGLPICTDPKPDGSIYTHAETCATYEYADDVCARCASEMGWECGGCINTMNGLISLRHPDCKLHVGPIRCPEHGGRDARYQCQEPGHDAPLTFDRR